MRPEDYLFKRAFDLAFSLGGLMVLSPVMLVIAIAMKAQDGGPILYGQE